jgi:hypothetical protein
MQAKSIAIAMFFSSLYVLPVCVSAKETVTSIKPAWVAVPDNWNKTVGALCTEYIQKTEPVRGLRCDGSEVDLEPGYAGYQLNNCKLKGSGAVMWKSIYCDKTGTLVRKIERQNAARKSKCRQAGGIWLGSRYRRCNMPTTDAGRECVESSQCRSGCVANTTSSTGGRCYGWELFLGCGLITVEDGKKRILCVD